MHKNIDKRQAEDLLKKAEKIGELLKLDGVATFNMAWKEPRLDLPGGGECYPLIDVLERLAEMAVVKKTAKKKQKRIPKPEEGTTEV